MGGPVSNHPLTGEPLPPNPPPPTAGLQGLCSCLSELGDDAVALCAGHVHLLCRLVQLLDESDAECRAGVHSANCIMAPEERNEEGAQSSASNTSATSSCSSTVSGCSSDGAGEEAGGEGDESDGGPGEGRGARSSGGSGGLSAALALLACRRMAATRVGRQVRRQSGLGRVASAATQRPTGVSTDCGFRDVELTCR